MSAIPSAPGGGVATSSGRAAPAGRTEVRDKAIQKVCDHVAAQTVGVSPDRVRTWATDHRGGIALRIEAPMPVPPLSDTAAITAAGSVLVQAERVQREVRAELTRMLGSPVTRIDLTITGAVLMSRRRVS